MKHLLSVILLMLPLAAGTQAQTVRTLINADSLSIGARNRLVVSIRHDGSRQALFPDQVDAPAPPGAIGTVGDLELLSRISSGARLLSDGSRVDSVLYEMTTFALDTAFVEARVGLASELDTSLFSSVQGLLPVRSAVPDSAADIRDLAPLAEFPRAVWPWVLALLAAAAAFWWFFFRTRVEEVVVEAVPAAPAEPAFAEAMRRLGALSRERVDETRVKPYFVELSDILRTYLARRTSVPARELTTSELVGHLRSRPTVRPERVDEVKRVLSDADLVKFADFKPEMERIQLMVEATRSSIERTEADFAPPSPSNVAGDPPSSSDGHPRSPGGDGAAGGTVEVRP